ncbi:hypothetical protein GOBAR_DD03881 [Gossypium barbadense]|nr:hypothetical protein GOBAR_DD03881 [Gossypium barbadense]
MADSDDESGEQNHNGGNAHSEASGREQDRFLPIANVSRIMKKALPPNAKISKDAKETVQECVSEFISFITGEASDKCQREKRKTINGDDLLWAMMTLGFEEYVEPLKIYLLKYREMEGEKSSMGRGEKDGARGRVVRLFVGQNPVLLSRNVGLVREFRRCHRHRKSIQCVQVRNMNVDSSYLDIST